MKQRLDILKWLTPLAMLLATACGYDNIVIPDERPEEKESPYVELRIAVPFANPVSTRANPLGGEEGNGRERGTLNEDKIHDINVFFYDDRNYGANGMDSNPETPILFHIYYNLKDPNDVANSKLSATLEDELNGSFESQYVKLRFDYRKEDIPNAEGVKFLAIANVGELSSNNLKTLGALRDLDLTSSSSFSSWISDDVFSKNAKKMDYFLMSTAYNSNYTNSGLSTGSNTLSRVNGSYSGTSTLQRIYARIDLWYNAADNAGGVTDSNVDITELEYPVEGALGNTVYLTNILAVNVKKNASYVFKKVTSEHIGDWNLSYLKAINTFSWGGKESPNEGPYSGSSGVDIPLNYVMEPSTILKNTDGTIGDFRNPDETKETLKDWYGNTALDNIKKTIVDSDNGKLSEYYHMPRSKGIYDPDYNCDHISIISYANENTHATDCFHPNFMTGLAFRAVYVPEIIYKYDVTATTTDGLVPVTELKEKDKVYRYSPTNIEQSETNSLYFDKYEDMNAYKQAHPEDMAECTTFNAVKHGDKWGFVCYYNLWLRHYNNEDADPQAAYPMEYATIRNNIYRIKVGFTGPGDLSPTMREPDTMQARIFVRKWNYREEETFYFE